MKGLKVTVIGCGPAGLAAAHAATGFGAEVTILAPKQKSPLLGPLLLQRPIPGVTRSHPDAFIKQIVVNGSILDYRYKLYGDINIGINGDVLEDGYPAWKMAATYDALWALYSDQIIDMTLTPQMLIGLQKTTHQDLFVNTARADRFCLTPHHCKFTSAPVAIRQEVAYVGQPENTIIFQADPNIAWARSSLIFDNPVTEWALDHAPDEDVMIIRKPISTTCRCHPHVLRTGRFGSWQNQKWVDGAYWDVYKALTGMKHKVIWEAIV